MTVRLGETGDVFLEGTATVEDAEPLLQALQAKPEATVDWTQCRQIHTAVFQVLLAAGRVPIGPCGDSWIELWSRTGEVIRQGSYPSWNKSAARPFT